MARTIIAFNDKDFGGTKRQVKVDNHLVVTENDVNIAVDKATNETIEELIDKIKGEN